jgi:hypothetical protein
MPVIVRSLAIATALVLAGVYCLHRDAILARRNILNEKPW